MAELNYTRDRILSIAARIGENRSALDMQLRLGQMAINFSTFYEEGSISVVPTVTEKLGRVTLSGGVRMMDAGSSYDQTYGTAGRREIDPFVSARLQATKELLVELNGFFSQSGYHDVKLQLVKYFNHMQEGEQHDDLKPNDNGRIVGGIGETQEGLELSFGAGRRVYGIDLTALLSMAPQQQGALAYALNAARTSNDEGPLKQILSLNAGMDYARQARVGVQYEAPLKFWRGHWRGHPKVTVPATTSAARQTIDQIMDEAAIALEGETLSAMTRVSQMPNEIQNAVLEVHGGLDDVAAAMKKDGVPAKLTDRYMAQFQTLVDDYGKRAQEIIRAGGTVADLQSWNEAARKAWQDRVEAYQKDISAQPNVLVRDSRGTMHVRAAVLANIENLRQLHQNVSATFDEYIRVMTRVDQAGNLARPNAPTNLTARVNAARQAYMQNLRAHAEAVNDINTIDLKKKDEKTDRFNTYRAALVSDVKALLGSQQEDEIFAAWMQYFVAYAWAFDHGDPGHPANTLRLIRQVIPDLEPYIVKLMDKNPQAPDNRPLNMRAPGVLNLMDLYSRPIMLGQMTPQEVHEQILGTAAWAREQTEQGNSIDTTKAQDLMKQSQGYNKAQAFAKTLPPTAETPHERAVRSSHLQEDVAQVLDAILRLGGVDPTDPKIQDLRAKRINEFAAAVFSDHDVVSVQLEKDKPAEQRVRAMVFLQAHTIYFADIMQLLGVTQGELKQWTTEWLAGVDNPTFVRSSYWVLYAVMTNLGGSVLNEAKVNEVRQHFAYMRALAPFAIHAGLFGKPGAVPTTREHFVLLSYLASLAQSHVIPLGRRDDRGSEYLVNLTDLIGRMKTLADAQGVTITEQNALTFLVESVNVLTLEAMLREGGNLGNQLQQNLNDLPKLLAALGDLFDIQLPAGARFDDLARNGKQLATLAMRLVQQSIFEGRTITEVVDGKSKESIIPVPVSELIANLREAKRIKPRLEQILQNGRKLEATADNLAYLRRIGQADRRDAYLDKLEYYKGAIGKLFGLTATSGKNSFDISNRNLWPFQQVHAYASQDLDGGGQFMVTGINQNKTKLPIMLSLKDLMEAMQRLLPLALITPATHEDHLRLEPQQWKMIQELATVDLLAAKLGYGKNWQAKALDARNRLAPKIAQLVGHPVTVANSLILQIEMALIAGDRSGQYKLDGPDGRIAFYDRATRDLAKTKKALPNLNWNLDDVKGVITFYMQMDMGKQGPAYAAAVEKLGKWLNDYKTPTGEAVSFSEATILTLTHWILSNPDLSDDELRQVVMSVTDQIQAANVRQAQMRPFEAAASPRVTIENPGKADIQMMPAPTGFWSKVKNLLSSAESQAPPKAGSLANPAQHPVIVPNSASTQSPRYRGQRKQSNEGDLEVMPIWAGVPWLTLLALPKPGGKRNRDGKKSRAASVGNFFIVAFGAMAAPAAAQAAGADVAMHPSIAPNLQPLAPGIRPQETAPNLVEINQGPALTLFLQLESFPNLQSAYGTLRYQPSFPQPNQQTDPDGYSAWNTAFNQLVPGQAAADLILANVKLISDPDTLAVYQQLMANPSTYLIYFNAQQTLFQIPAGGIPPGPGRPSPNLPSPTDIDYLISWAHSFDTSAVFKSYDLLTQLLNMVYSNKYIPAFYVLYDIDLSQGVTPGNIQELLNIVNDPIYDINQVQSALQLITLLNGDSTAMAGFFYAKGFNVTFGSPITSPQNNVVFQILKPENQAVTLPDEYVYQPHAGPYSPDTFIPSVKAMLALHQAALNYGAAFSVLFHKIDILTSPISNSASETYLFGLVGTAGFNQANIVKTLQLIDAFNAPANVANGSLTAFQSIEGFSIAYGGSVPEGMIADVINIVADPNYKDPQTTVQFFINANTYWSAFGRLSPGDKAAASSVFLAAFGVDLNGPLTPAVLSVLGNSQFGILYTAAGVFRNPDQAMAFFAAVGHYQQAFENLTGNDRTEALRVFQEVFMVNLAAPLQASDLAKMGNPANGVLYNAQGVLNDPVQAAKFFATVGEYQTAFLALTGQAKTDALRVFTEAFGINLAANITPSALKTLGDSTYGILYDAQGVLRNASQAAQFFAAVGQFEDAFNALSIPGRKRIDQLFAEAYPGSTLPNGKKTPPLQLSDGISAGDLYVLGDPSLGILYDENGNLRDPQKAMDFYVAAAAFQDAFNSSKLTNAQRTRLDKLFGEAYQGATLKLPNGTVLPMAALHMSDGLSAADLFDLGYPSFGILY
ncbi:MAG TPA: hypothetical protein VMU17_02110, partial [Elusimicrobiota bacterium]|nr:hypothetical protein [Elusimicrobiota bacterium]